MKDFNIAKYLRENSLGSHAILGAYVDLHALKEESQLNEASLELDWASGIDSLKAKCKKHGLTCKVVKEFGPGGGNPLVKIIGSKDNIISWLEDGYADADQLEDFVADIKENLEEEEVGNNKPVSKVPYDGAEEKLDGFGDEFDQVAPVEEAEMEENAWMENVDGTDAYKVGNWTCYYDHPGILVWSNGNTPLSKLAVYATPNWDNDGTTPIQIDIDEESQDQMTLKQSEFADFNDYANAMKPYLDRIENLESNWGSLAPVEEDFSYDDDKDDVNPFPSLNRGGYSDEQDKFDRMMGLSHEYIGKVSPVVKKTIDALRADGFDDQDIIDFLATDLSTLEEEVTVSSSGVEMEEALSYEDLENDLNKIAIKMRRIATFTHNNAGDFTFVTITADDDDDPAYNKKVQNAGYKEVVNLINKKYPTLKVIEKEQNFDKVSFVIARNDKKKLGEAEMYTVDFGTNTQDFELDRDRNVLIGLKPQMGLPGSSREEDIIPIMIDANGYLSTKDPRVKDISPASNASPFSDPGYMNRD